MEKIFYIDEIRDLIRKYDRQEISLSKLTEILNEKATGKNAIQLYQEYIRKNEHEQMDCPFKYCSQNPKCEVTCYINKTNPNQLK